MLTFGKNDYLPVKSMFPSPEQETIFLILDAGKNLAEKILAL